MPRDEPSGLLILDKPRGPTSHDAVAHVRRVLQTRSVGHAGTLDPMATGVLLVLIGECTKLSAYLTLDRKSYDATVRFGEATDTGDALGVVNASAAVPDELVAALARVRSGAFVADTVPDVLHRALLAERERTRQVPPAHAAIKQGGVAAYKRARRGEQVTLPARDVTVFELTVKGASLEPAALQVSMEVSKGYYVRSFATDLGDTLGVPSHLSELRRTASGPYAIDRASSWDAGEQEWRAAMIPVEQVAGALLPRATLRDEGVRRALYGQRLTEADFDAAPPQGAGAWFAPDGSLVAIGDQAKGWPAVLRAFPRPAGVC